MLKKTIHRTGLTIISHYNPQVPSFALSYTLKSGSRSETIENCGIHHFIEHMLFKGSDNYDLKQIAELSDRLGGSLNAYTSKEVTQYYIKAIDEKFEETFDLLSDMIIHSTFPETEFDKEKNVILQEIKEAIDSPDSHSFELFYENLFPSNPMGYPVGGTETSVKGIDRSALLDYYHEKYRPENLILALSGNIEHDRLVRMADEKFKHYPDAKPKEVVYIPTTFHFQNRIKHRDLKQLYVITGFRGIPSNSPHRYSFMVANDILGSGMSSRLFQNIREEKGLAYTISSFPDTFMEDGLLMIYSIIEPDDLSKYLGAIRQELELLKKNGIRETELERSKDHIKSSVILGLESNTTMMQFIVNQEIYHRQSLGINEINAQIRKLKKSDIDFIFNSLLNLENHSVFCYGNLKKPEEKISF